MGLTSSVKQTFYRAFYEVRVEHNGRRERKVENEKDSIYLVHQATKAS